MSIGLDQPFQKGEPYQKSLHSWIFPLAFWEELMNAVSMVLANWFVWQRCVYLADQSSHVGDLMLVKYFSVLHCPCSVSYHLILMMRCRYTEERDRNTWTRVLDMGFTHVCCVAFSWALTHGITWFVCVNALANAVCLFLMMRRYALGGHGGSESEAVEYLRLGVCSMAYPTAILMQGRLNDFFCAWGLLVLMGACQFISPFGHAVSRVPLALFIFVIAQNAAGTGSI